MILIGAINVGIGFLSYDGPGPTPEKIELVIPRSQYARDAGVSDPLDALPADGGSDAAPVELHAPPPR